MVDVVVSILLHEQQDQSLDGRPARVAQLDGLLEGEDDLRGRHAVELGNLGLEEVPSPPLGPGVLDFFRIPPGLLELRRLGRPRIGIRRVVVCH